LLYTPATYARLREFWALKNKVRFLVLFSVIVLALSFARSVAAVTIISCSFGSAGGDDISRGFYVTSYPGSNLAKVHLQYDANPAGTFTVSLTARQGAFNGPIIGSTQTVTLSLPSTSSEADAIFDFGGAAVTPGSTVTFTQAEVAGSGTVYFNLGTGSCSGATVIETEGTTPPLDTTRRTGIGLEITQLTGPNTDWAVTSVSMVPNPPQAGQPVTFTATLVALSTSGSYPQNVEVHCKIDAFTCGSGSVSYPGPTGNPATVTAATPWTATPGTHTLTWTASAVGDPNPSNNVMSTTFVVAPQAPFDFSLSVSPLQQSVAPGESTTYSVTVTPISGSPQPVGLSVSGAPAGVSASFSAPLGTPPFSSTLSVATTSGTSSGTVILTITGSGGGTIHITQVTLTISQSSDFSLTANPTSQNVASGGTTSYAIHVGALNGFNSPVSLSVSGAPTGANTVLSTTSATPDFDSTLTVTLPANSPTGTFTLTISGNGGGQSHQVNLVLVVSPGQPTQTTAQTSQTATTSTTVPSPNDMVSMLQQNPLLLVALVIILILIVLFASRGRKKQPSTASTPTGAVTFCPKCGTQNPSSQEFCGKCGNKLH